MTYQFTNPSHNRIARDLFTLARDKDRISRARIASALIYKGSVISFGFNQDKTHPLQQKYSKNVHAVHLHSEIDSIKNSFKAVDLDILSKCTLIVCRAKFINNQWQLGMAKPCEGCNRAIHAFNIRKTYYSTDNGDFQCL